MAPAHGGSRGRGGSRDAAGGGEEVRKGRWTVAEDEMLLDHVRTHGPRDWSSIQSKGLLPRTGKSCRLRWVNKLRPDLKTGCKFSAEEERVAMDLQTQFGNKWARIATYLPGRTDNDVKNFWSTRQKRLARLLRTPLRNRSAKSSNSKAPVSYLQSAVDQVPFVGNSSGGQCCADAPLMEYQDASLVPHDQAGPGFFSFEESYPLQVIPSTESEGSSSNAVQLAPELAFNHQTPFPLLDYPGLPEKYSIVPGFVGASAMDDFPYQELLPIMHPAPMMLPFFGTEFAHDAVKTETGKFFDDLPLDMFDSLDQLPPPSSPSRTSSPL